MQQTIYFLNKALILTDTAVDIEDYYRMPSSELSRANVLKIFETANTIVVIDSMIEPISNNFLVSSNMLRRQAVWSRTRRARC